MPIATATFLDAFYGASDGTFTEPPTQLPIGHDDGAGEVDSNGTIRFEIPSHPVAASINSATLTLYAANDDDAVTFGLSVEDDFTAAEPASAADMAGRTVLGEASESPTGYSANDPVEFDVTDQLAALIAGETSALDTIQFHLRAQLPDTGHAIEEWKVSGDVPELVIDYEPQGLQTPNPGWPSGNWWMGQH